MCLSIRPSRLSAPPPPAARQRHLRQDQGIYQEAGHQAGHQEGRHHQEEEQRRRRTQLGERLEQPQSLTRLPAAQPRLAAWPWQLGAAAGVVADPASPPATAVQPRFCRRRSSAAPALSYLILPLGLRPPRQPSPAGHRRVFRHPRLCTCSRRPAAAPALPCICPPGGSVPTLPPPHPHPLPPHPAPTIPPACLQYGPDRPKFLGPYSDRITPSYLNGAFAGSCRGGNSPVRLVQHMRDLCSTRRAADWAALLLGLAAPAGAAAPACICPSCSSGGHALCARRAALCRLVPTCLMPPQHTHDCLQASSPATTAGTPPACPPTRRPSPATGRLRSSTPAGPCSVRWAARCLHCVVVELGARRRTTLWRQRAVHAIGGATRVTRC